MTMTMLWSYVSSTCTPFEVSNLPRIWALIFVSSKVGGADDMKRQPWCVCSDLGPSPPRRVVSYLHFCVLFYVFRILSFHCLRFVCLSFFFLRFFCSFTYHLGIHTLVFACEFFRVLPQIRVHQGVSQ